MPKLIGNAVMSNGELPTVEQVKASLLAQVRQRKEAEFQLGCAFASGPLAGERLQCRNDTDRTNWLASRAVYRDYVSAGQGNVSGASFRTQANANFSLTFTQGIAAIDQVFTWGQAIMSRSWVVQDLVNAAETVAELEAVAAAELYSGWPSNV